jgi:hypothetical protein
MAESRWSAIIETGVDTVRSVSWMSIAIGVVLGVVIARTIL